MSFEGSPENKPEVVSPDQVLTPETAAPDPYFFTDGSINVDRFAVETGFGLEELSSEVEYAGKRSTVAHMLAHDLCPVGHAVRRAYSEQGLAGSVAAIEQTAKLMFMEVTLEVSEATSARETARVAALESQKKSL